VKREERCRKREERSKESWRKRKRTKGGER